MERRWAGSRPKEGKKFLLQKNIKQENWRRGEAGKQGSRRQNKMPKALQHLAQRQTKLLPPDVSTAPRRPSSKSAIKISCSIWCWSEWREQNLCLWQILSCSMREMEIQSLSLSPSHPYPSPPTLLQFYLPLLGGMYLSQPLAARIDLGQRGSWLLNSQVAPSYKGKKTKSCPLTSLALSESIPCSQLACTRRRIGI